ncbi:ATPase [candidate division TA06 bacterium B3_TA06]|uniref:ATPase n=1 Tax=candidate division TA06 bacterium B3_TA06 TaxID=2012487 RepID=A0A532UU76_UNCT6|nr:MAG: ATPase [candidate division TA06 bacterium B3_TA06]
MLDRIRGQGRYDCIVTLSGGRDSSYMLLKAVRDYKLKALAFNYRNPFTHPVASENIRRLQKCLGVDLIQFELPGVHLRTMRHNLLSWMCNPSPAMVPMMCVGCKTLWKTVLCTAWRYGVRAAFSGGNPYEQTTFKRELLGVDAEASVAKYYTSYIFGLAREVGKNIRYLAPKVLPPTILGYLYSSPQAPFVRLLGRGLTRISLFKYLPWSESEVLSRVRDELDWHSPPDYPSTWRFDCKVDDVKNYIYLRLVGVTEKDDFYSRMVRAGLMTRDEALVRVKRENEVDIDLVKAVLAEVGIPLERLDRAIDRYLEAHPR